MVQRPELLSTIAETQPHAAYATFTKVMIRKWSYLTRTIPNISTHLQPLEDMIRSHFIPSLTGRVPPDDTERELLALPQGWMAWGSSTLYLWATQNILHPSKFHILSVQKSSINTHSHDRWNRSQRHNWKQKPKFELKKPVRGATLQQAT